MRFSIKDLAGRAPVRSVASVPRAPGGIWTLNLLIKRHVLYCCAASTAAQEFKLSQMKSYLKKQRQYFCFIFNFFLCLLVLVHFVFIWEVRNVYFLFPRKMNQNVKSVTSSNFFSPHVYFRKKNARNVYIEFIIWFDILTLEPLRCSDALHSCMQGSGFNSTIFR